MHRLAIEGRHRAAELLIDPENHASLGVAVRAGFTPRGAEVRGQLRFTRAIPPLTYSDGIVTIRRQDVADLDTHLSAIDFEQVKWLWIPEDEELWKAMNPAQQRDRNRKWLRANHDSFGTGPKWTFAVDTRSTSYVAYVDCDLANSNAPTGEANVSYSCHPEYRGNGYASRAVRLVMRFLADHTATPRAHLVIDRDNVASLRVARSVSAVECGTFVNDQGRTMIRYVVDLNRTGGGSP
jgi:RimJ/RimL family protein N-acetyltransferase